MTNKTQEPGDLCGRCYNGYKNKSDLEIPAGGLVVLSNEILQRCIAPRIEYLECVNPPPFGGVTIYLVSGWV